MSQSREGSPAQNPGASSPRSSSTVGGDLSSPRSSPSPSPSPSLSLFYLLFQIASVSVTLLAIPTPMALRPSPDPHLLHTRTSVYSRHCHLGKRAE